MLHLEFKYDSRGYGDLVLFEDINRIESLSCRSGSISEDGKLHDCIDTGEWWLKDDSVDTDESNMSALPGARGWKKRLWKRDDYGNFIYTHYLIHPIMHGTLGCIGIIGINATSFRIKLDDITREQGYALVKVTMKDGQV
jgi:hypothetical protein